MIKESLFLSIFSILLHAFKVVPQKHNVHFVEAAHSRRRVVVTRRAPERYDRSVTTFDKSGRLLQVEYGMEAANRGSNVLAVLSGNGTVVNLVIAASPTTAASRASSTTPSSSAVNNAASSSSSSLPSILLNKVHRLDHHVFMISSGLSGDARMLANYLRQHCQDHLEHFGESPTVQEVAKRASDLQHLLTRIGGARPFGCTAIIVGIDAQGARIFRTDPGGILEDCLYCAGGSDQTKLMTLMAEEYENIKSKSEQAVVARALVQTMSEAMNSRTVPMDVWVIEKNDERRGNLKARCMLNVVAENVNDMVDRLLSTR